MLVVVAAAAVVVAVFLLVSFVWADDISWCVSIVQVPCEI